MYQPSTHESHPERTVQLLDCSSRAVVCPLQKRLVQPGFYQDGKEVSINYSSQLTLFIVRSERYPNSYSSKQTQSSQIVSFYCFATQSCTSLTTSVSLLYECSPGITVKALRFIAQAISQTNAGPIDVTIRESCSPCPIIWLKSCS